MRGGEACHALELRAQVSGARVAQTVGYLVQRQFAIGQQLFGPLYFLGDDILFDGGACGFGEQLAQCAVVFAESTCQIVGQVGLKGRIRGLVNEADDEVLHLLHRLHPAVVYQFEFQGFQRFLYPQTEVGCQLFGGDGDTQLHRQRMQAQRAQGVVHGQDAAVAYHVLDV